MSETEELDYMSDDFLQKCLNANSDVRPGLIKSHSEKRNHNLLKKKKDTDEINKKNNKPHTVVQSERLEEGLNKPISSTNKGFSMLQKMGFVPGTGLGKSKSGIVEPIPVNIKNDRQGLGRAEAIKQIRIQKENIRKKKLEKINDISDYRALLSKKSKEREVNSDLRKSQRICHQLDVVANVSEPEENWFWPEDATETEEEEEKEKDEEEEDNPTDNYEPLEKLEMLTIYLRQSYCYCIWCGVQYEDDKDLRDNCPGLTRDDH